MRATLLAIAVSTVGCGHAQPPVGARAARSNGAPPLARAAHEKQSSAAEVGQPGARPPSAPGRPELSPTPSGMMLAGGPLLIQRALATRGYLPEGDATGVLDTETASALRRFQGDEDLARTGAPDHETVRRLGLSPGQVFRAAGGG